MSTENSNIDIGESQYSSSVKDDRFTINNETSNNSRLAESPEQKRETTRSTIAKIYLWCFFVILAAGMAFCACFAQQVSDVKDMLVAISGVLSGPLGFIIGYYFKASKE